MEITLTHLSGSKSGQVENFTVLPLRFGRSEQCQVRFDPVIDRKVSSVHAELRREDTGLFLVDLGSTNGTLVNGALLGGSAGGEAEEGSDAAGVGGSARVHNHAVIEFGPGGPRLRLSYEDTGGINFSELRREKERTDRLSRKGMQEHLLQTEGDRPAFDEALLLGTEPVRKAKKAQGLPPWATNPAVVAGVLGIGAALLVWLLLR